tara:strand:- start:2041 stop:3018 length:978 start_codon:yes stop_codon:yes gene_type:complete
MIIKITELNKIDFNKFQIFLLYGKNEGLQNEIIENKFKKDFVGQITRYEESEFILNFDTIVSEIRNKSLFEDKKILIISRVSEKILKYIEELSENNLSDIRIILKCRLLDKRSKLRNFFEKNKLIIVIPFYEDTDRSLTSVIINFLNKNKIKMSRETINLLVNRVSGDRQNLKLELDKIFQYSLTNKNITIDVVEKLTNLSENHDVNELANNYLSKNTKNVAKILNENNYSDDDCVLILRTILNKSKKLLHILNETKYSKNLDEIISKTKPPIFWKEKDSVKMQVNSWNIDELREKIYEINDIESLIKNNSKNSLNIVSDFIISY